MPAKAKRHPCRAVGCTETFQRQAGEKSLYCSTHRGRYYRGVPREQLSTPLACEVCGRVRQVPLRLVRRGLGKTCSRECRNRKLASSRRKNGNSRGQPPNLRLGT